VAEGWLFSQCCHVSWEKKSKKTMQGIFIFSLKFYSFWGTNEKNARHFENTKH
jgi:hypothetical protein